MYVYGLGLEQRESVGSTATAFAVPTTSPRSIRSKADANGPFGRDKFTLELQRHSNRR